MDRQEAINFVIRGLASHRNRNDIIKILCEQGGMNWTQAEQFVQQVEIEHHKRHDRVVEKNQSARE